MGLFSYSGLIFSGRLGSDKNGSLFAVCLWWFWYSMDQKIKSLTGVFMESELMVFSLIPCFDFPHGVFLFSIGGILMKIIFKAPSAKISY